MRSNLDKITSGNSIRNFLFCEHLSAQLVGCLFFFSFVDLKGEMSRETPLMKYGILK